MAATQLQRLQTHLDSQVIGQKQLTKSILISLLADGHLLVEGPPGLAKTRAINSLSDGIDANFHRIQFTPDLLPADLTGTDIYRPETGEFIFQKGPLFHNLILADEINRAPAKVQAALLEAMAERQITVGGTTYPLPELFLVMATQNPLEQEGTYPLPEAQLDRFLMHVEIDYPDTQTEVKILRLTRGESIDEISGKLPPNVTKISQEDIKMARQEVLNLYLSEAIETYIVQLVIATREPDKYSNDLSANIELGVSPRATIALEKCARANAWLEGRDFVGPDDVQTVLPNVLRHRLILSYHAQAKGITHNQIIDQIKNIVPVP
ncbi:MAG: MoxR family ATPase [Pseudomonadota bacterium]